MLKITFIFKNIDRFRCKWILRTYAMQDSDRSIFMPSPQTAAMGTLSSCLMDWGLLYFHKDGFDRLQPYVSRPYKTYISRLMYMWAKLCNLRSSVCPVAIATAQHISKHRATAELRALPGRCQGLIHARSDMSEGKGRRTHTHTGYPPILLAGDSHGNGSRNPFSTDTGTAVQIVDESRLVWAFLH